MKIAEIEAKIERGDCREETIELFKSALKRVPKSYRCQHCYTTAASMPPYYHKQAIEMIEYGLREYCNDWLDSMRSYHNIASILESNKDYIGAKKSYIEALYSIDPDLRSDYDSEYASHIMRMEMHISNFEYTDDLENYYNIAIQDDEFSQAFQIKRFYRLLAEIIILSKCGDKVSAKITIIEAKKMLRPSFIGPLTQLLARKGFIETSGATKEAIAFLRRAKRELRT